MKIKAKKITAIFILIIICLINLVSCKPTILPEIISWGENLEAAFINSKDGLDFDVTIKNLVNEEEPELINEFVRRMKDIKRNGASEYKMSIISMTEEKNKSLTQEDVSLAENERLVRLNESYLMNSKLHNNSFWAKFVIHKGRAYYSDLEFGSRIDGNISLFYAPETKSLVPIILDEAKLAYTKAGENLTGSIYNVSLKVYSDKNLFSEFIKPSIQFSMAGWNEFGESIKINLGELDYKYIINNIDKTEVEEGFRVFLRKVFKHEMSHLITGEITGNNIPYWLSEGIAMSAMSSTKKESNADPSVPLDELSNLNIENASEDSVIDLYYSDCQIYTEALIEKLGYKGLGEILNDIGEYPINNENSSDSFVKTNKIFEEVIMKRYAMGTRKFGEKLIK